MCENHNTKFVAVSTLDYKVKNWLKKNKSYHRFVQHLHSKNAKNYNNNNKCKIGICVPVIPKIHKDSKHNLIQNPSQNQVMFNH